MRKEEFVQFVEEGVFYITTVFSKTEAKQYKKNMLVLFEKLGLNATLDYLTLNYFNQYGERQDFFYNTLTTVISDLGVDIKIFLNDFNIDLAKGLRLDTLFAWYYEVPSGNIVTKKYVYDNINLLMGHLDFYRVHNRIFIDGDPVFIPSTDIPDNMKIIDYAKFLVDLNYLFEYYTPAELSDAQEKLKPVLETECAFTKQELKEKIVSLDIKNQRLLAEIRRLLR